MYGNNYGYYNTNRNMSMPVQPIMQPIAQPQPFVQGQQNGLQIGQQSGLQGKMVDNIEVVKVTDIPLDGSISYFPLTDGSTIVTKQLQNDGTSKTTIYRAIEEQETEKSKYVTFEDIDSIKDQIRDIKRELKDIRKRKGEE